MTPCEHLLPRRHCISCMHRELTKLRAENAELRQELAGERERIASMCWADRGHFASDLAALHFAELVMARKGEGDS